MKLSDILKKDFIIADLTEKNKAGVLQELIDFLKNKNVVNDIEGLHNSLIEREKLGSTGIGENVAIPHAKSGELDQILTLFARSTEGVDFESLDQKAVNFVCLVVAPSNSTGHHLKALARISRLLKNQVLRQAILDANSAEEIYSALLEEDSKFI
jgi:PTS system nitrogen regulatory IIA component